MKFINKFIDLLKIHFGDNLIISLNKKYLTVKNNFESKKRLPEADEKRKTKIGLHNLKNRYEYLTGKKFLINDPQQKNAADKEEFIVEIPLIKTKTKEG